MSAQFYELMKAENRFCPKFLQDTYLLDKGMLVIIQPLMFLKILPDP